MDSTIHVQCRRELASIANLSAHPMAGMAASLALGFGLGGQVFGYWMGAMAGATEIGRALLVPYESAANDIGRPRGRLEKASAGAGKKR